jgi:hypothetical protein
MMQMDEAIMVHSANSLFSRFSVCNVGWGPRGSDPPPVDKEDKWLYPISRPRNAGICVIIPLTSGHDKSVPFS